MPTIRALVGFVCLAAFCACLPAQSANPISLRLLDGKTGLPVKASNFLVRIDHRDTIHPEWVQMNDDGSVTVTLPAGVKEFSVKATYDMSMETFINCDAAKESDKERNIWYPVSIILKAGVAAPNECGKTDFTAKPGEFIFFVRKRDWRDRPSD